MNVPSSRRRMSSGVVNAELTMWSTYLVVTGGVNNHEWRQIRTASLPRLKQGGSNGSGHPMQVTSVPSRLSFLVRFYLAAPFINSALLAALRFPAYRSRLRAIISKILTGGPLCMMSTAAHGPSGSIMICGRLLSSCDYSENCSPLLARVAPRLPDGEPRFKMAGRSELPRVLRDQFIELPLQRHPDNGYL